MDADLIAGEILQARAAGRCLDASTLPIDDHIAYSVQRRITEHRQNAGESIVGYKLGYTSQVMREQMGIASPNLGPLTDAMVVADGDLLPTAIHPKVEPEIALILGVDVESPLTPEECRGAVREARLALEVVDSIWCDYRFTWAHNTADGSSAAFVVVGPRLPEADLAGTEVTLEHNHTPTGTGTGAAAMGDPYAALAWLTTQTAEHGRHLRAGDVVITGGLVAAVSLHPGDTVSAHALGVRVSVRR